MKAHTVRFIASKVWLLTDTLWDAAILSQHNVCSAQQHVQLYFGSIPMHFQARDLGGEELRPSAGALVGSRQDECCWSLNGRNRSAAHEWPAGGGGRHLLVLLRPAQCTGSHPIKHSNSSSGSSSATCYPSSRFWLSVGELSGLVVVMSAPSGSGQVQPWVVAAW